MSTIQDIAFQKMGGATATLADYQGKVALIVNVASKCGLTPQYEALEKLYRLKQVEGLEILGFPANNFLEQEPGSDAEIQDFCSVTYDVTFPLFSILVTSIKEKPAPALPYGIIKRVYQSSLLCTGCSK